MNDTSDRVFLSHWRPDNPSVRCACGHGVFQRSAADQPWQCEACGVLPDVAAQVAAKGARLLYVCASCDGCGFRVSMQGLICIGCGARSAFDDLFRPSR